MLLSKTTIILKKRIMTVLFLGCCLSSFQAFSQEPVLLEENSPELKVKYLEGDNDALVFNLKYDNDSGTDFKLMVLGETGEVLFQDNFSGKKFRKNVRLPRLTDTDGVTFLIRPLKKNIQLSYRVRVTSKVNDAPLVANN